MAYSICRSVSGRRDQSVKRAPLSTVKPEPAFNEVRIADLFGLADRHHRDLRVEDRVRGLARKVVDDLHILPAGVEDLEHVLVVDQQFEQRAKIDPGGQRIDRGGFLVIRDLHQAQFRPIGVLAHESRYRR